MKKIMYLFLISLLFLNACWITTTNGTHNGQITAVEKSGLFVQTWDIYVKSDISSSQEENYCVRDESVIPKMQELSKTRQRVTIKYYDVFMINPFACNDYTGIAYDAEPIE